MPRKRLSRGEPIHKILNGPEESNMMHSLALEKEVVFAIKSSKHGPVRDVRAVIDIRTPAEDAYSQREILGVIITPNGTVPFAGRYSTQSRKGAITQLDGTII